jgi:16S rRNA (guanine527-N7)-methyltransferase
MPHPLMPDPSTRRSADVAHHARILLVGGAAQLGLPLSELQLAQLARYQALLSEWGEKINLTALRDPADIVTRHFLDSLALVRALPSTTQLLAAGLDRSLVDVGSGAGFPGVLCALLRPELHVTLVERIGKKAAFLLALRRELGLHYRVEAISADRLVTRYAIAVSRAALPLAEWLPLATALSAPSGFIFAMTTPREPMPAQLETPLQVKDTQLMPCADITYDVGAGSHRLLGFRKAC